VIHPQAPAEPTRKGKRVAAPGKKLGRPRKNPVPEVAAAAPVNRADLSIVDMVAPILEAAPASVAAPMFDVPAPAPVVEAPKASEPAPAAAAIPARPIVNAPAGEVAVEPSAAAPAEAEAEEFFEAAPVPAILEEEIAQAKVETSPVPTVIFEAAAIPEPALEEIPPSAPKVQSAIVEEAPAPKPAALESAPSSAPVAMAVAAANQESLAVESLSLLESLRDWRRKEEELEQTIRAKYVAPNRPAMPVQAEEPVREAAPVARAKPSLANTALARVAENKQFLLIAALLALLVAAAVFITVNKTRGSGSASFPNPSGPSQPAEKADPTPTLRAPTRPQRD
jgi:hypothetical protein